MQFHSESIVNASVLRGFGFAAIFLRLHCRELIHSA